MLITSELRIFAIIRKFDGKYFIIAMLFLKLKVKLRMPTRLGNGEGRVSGEAIDTGTRLDPPGYGARHVGRVMRVIGGDPSRLGLAAPDAQAAGRTGVRRGPYDR